MAHARSSSSSEPASMPMLTGVMTITSAPAVTQPVAASITSSGSLPVSLVYTSSMNPSATGYIPISNVLSQTTLPMVTSTLGSSPRPATVPLSLVEHSVTRLPRTPSALVAQQLQPINKFSGEDLDKEGETFQDWTEQFEMIAQMCGWDNQAKLVYLTTRFRSQAYSFYRTCTPHQRSDYDTVKLQLKERFTPVRIQAVYSSLFHQRKQGTNEIVDQYAQELRRLFYQAYLRVNQGSEEAEDFGRSVLAHQFVAGLAPTLRSKVAGSEGNFEQLLIKARFEEA